MTEATLRAAASWQAFKEGKSLFETGMVNDAVATQAGWQGTVKVGKRLMKVSVEVKSATNFDAHCPCADNQRSGAVCCHAVATGLSTIHKIVHKPTIQATVSKSLVPPAINQPWQILLPLNWRESLKRGKLSATLAIATGSEISVADEVLSRWLAGEGVLQKEVLSINIDGARTSTFLEAIADHPRLTMAKERLLIEIRSGERLRLIEANHLDDEIELIPDADVGTFVEIGGSFWQVGESTVIRVGEGSIPSAIAPTLLDLARGKSVKIATKQFFNQLSVWQEWLSFPMNCWLDALHFVPAKASFELSLEGSLEHLVAQLGVRYGIELPIPPGLGEIDGLPRLVGDRCEIRDLASEEKAVSRLAKSGFEVENFSSGRWLLKGEPAILNFLTRSLPLLRKEWSVIEGEQFSHAQKLVTVVSPRIEMRSSGEDWLSFDLTFQTDDGITVSAADVRHLLRGGKSVSKRRLVISDDLANVIDPMFSDLDLRQENGHYIANSRSGEIVKEIRNKLDKSNNNSQLDTEYLFEKPATLQVDLRPYQLIGAGWMLDRVQRYGGALLADDMGLGKTIQTIALVESLLEKTAPNCGVVMVVATASLLGNWRAEFARFAPARRVRILHGTGRDAERDQVSAGDVILTSFGTLARDLAYHLKKDYCAVVVDEASLMRNPDTDHAKALSKLRASYKIALTGTPIENGVKDLWSIFRFIQPGWLGGLEDFKNRYEQPLITGESSSAEVERLRLKISPFLLRRTKEQVAPELPSKLFIDEFCDLSPDQQGVYKQLLIEGRKRVDAIGDSGNKGAARMQMLTALLRLRQTCCDLALLGNENYKQLLVARRSAKLQRLLELIEEAVNGNHRMLIFSQFQKQLLEIEKCVNERGWNSLRLDGQSRNRQQMVDKFQQTDGPPVFLISLKTGGYGLNLTAADTVVHFDPWWNPAAEAQATDRAHRIGQTRPVTVYRLLTRGTVEEKVVRLQAKKRQLASAIDENGAGDAAGWSMQELESMLLD